MATSVVAGVKQVTVTVDNPGRDDFGGLRIWMSTVNGFTPGAGNLVYDGLDLTVTFGNLTAGTPYYFKMALYSQIDPTNVLTSAQYTATPTVPTVVADDILAGTIRGSAVVAGAFITRGSTLTADVLGYDDMVNAQGHFTSEIGVWTKGTGWTINTQRANAAATSNGNRLSYWKDTLVVGRSYKVVLDVPTWVSGTLSVYQAAGNTAIPNTNTTGVGKTVNFVATQTKFELVSVGFEGSVDNVVVTHVTPTTALPVQNTVDFPASGTAVIFDPVSATDPAYNKDYDLVTYTGKTATTLTGLSSSVLTHSAGCVIIPLAAKAMVIDQNVHEMRYYGDRGDGQYIKLAAIGLTPSSTYGEAIATFGASDFISGTAVEAYTGGLSPAGYFQNSDVDGGTYGIPALHANSWYGVGLEAVGDTKGVYGRNTGLGGAGGFFEGGNTSQSAAITLIAGGASLSSSTHAVHISFKGGVGGGPNAFTQDPASAQNQGDIYLRSDGRLVGCTNVAGTAWKAYVRDADTIWAANGTAAAPGVSFFNDPNIGMYRKAVDQLGFSSAGVERMYLSGDDLNVVKSVNAGNGTAAAPTFTFISDLDTGMYRKAANEVGFSAGGVEAFSYASTGRVNFSDSIGVGDAAPTASATINAKAVKSGDAGRQGLYNTLEIDNTAALTADRTYYGSFSDISTGLSIANRGAFNPTLYGAFNRAKAGPTSGTVGSAATLYGTYNAAVHQCSQAADVFTDLFGAYNSAVNSGTASGGDIWGSYNLARNVTAGESINSMYGVYAGIIVDAGAITNAYVFRGILTHTAGAITNKWGIHVAGADKHKLDGYIETDGIKFPAAQVASADANMLDDYEEGTFTPVVNGTTAAGTGTYSTQQGTYTKIGNRVCGDITLTWSEHTGTGNMEIGGLPFPRKTGGSSPVALYNQGVAFTAGNTLQGAILTGNSIITLTQNSGGGAATGVPIDTAATFRLAFTYETV